MQRQEQGDDNPFKSKDDPGRELGYCPEQPGETRNGPDEWAGGEWNATWPVWPWAGWSPAGQICQT